MRRSFAQPSAKAKQGFPLARTSAKHAAKPE
jgi:hypothetical protein